MLLIRNDVGPVHNQTDCGVIDFPVDSAVPIPACVTTNSDKWSHLTLTRDAALLLERNTRDQSACDTWHKEREHRLTASTFGRIIMRKASVNEKFLNSLICPRPFTCPATSYGLNSEKVAINMYRKKTGNHVHDCGFMVNPEFPFIGATPDGIVCDDGQSGIMEVKCPFSIRDWTIETALESYARKSTLFLEKKDNEILLKRNHAYWYQVQGQLLVSGAKFCDFITFTRQDLVIERIYPDVNTMSMMLEKLCNTYCLYIAKK